MIWDVQIRIPDLDFFSISSPDPEVKKHRIPDPHTAKNSRKMFFLTFELLRVFPHSTFRL